MNRALFGTTALIALAIGAAPIWAAPQQGSVISGGATITQSGTTTTINQTTSRSAINWQSFSVGAGEQVIFQQPSSSAVSLDRVTGGSASTIAGSLTANGQVILINSAGVLFTSSASVNLSGLIATTSDIADSDFMAGKLAFGKASPTATASVINQGTINIASGGYAVLSAAAVANTGTIQAKLGSVVLAGATAFTVDFDGDGLLQYAVTQGVGTSPGASALVEQGGTISADGGQVLLTARAAQGVVQHVINMDGVIEANNVTRSADGKLLVGTVTLDGGTIGVVEVGGSFKSSTLSVSGDSIVVNDGTEFSVGTLAMFAGGTQPSSENTFGSYTTTPTVSLITTDVTTVETTGVITAGGTAGVNLVAAPSSTPSTIVTRLETISRPDGSSYTVRVESRCYLGSACAPNFAALLLGSDANAIGQAAANASAVGRLTATSAKPDAAKESPPSGSSLIPGLLTDQTRPSRSGG